MFTGLVEGVGTVHAIEPGVREVRIVVELPEDMSGRDPCTLGESVAINGCCLTVVAIDGNRLAFQAGAETLSKTNLGGLTAGVRVNLERALKANGRFGGHVVQGHVDGVATVREIGRDGAWVRMAFAVPEELSRNMVPKGSVAVDGVSLTVVDAPDGGFSVALIPHTLAETNLGTRVIGDAVNVETDILGKYVERLLAARAPSSRG